MSAFTAPLIGAAPQRLCQTKLGRASERASLLGSSACSRDAAGVAAA